MGWSSSRPHHKHITGSDPQKNFMKRKKHRQAERQKYTSKTVSTRKILSHQKHTNVQLKRFHFKCGSQSEAIYIHTSQRVNILSLVSRLPNLVVVVIRTFKHFKKHLRLDFTKYSETSKLIAETLFLIKKQSRNSCRNCF